jgi:hypothetical protein
MATIAPPRGRPRTKPFDGGYEVLGDVELSPEEDAEVRRQIEQADSERDDAPVTMRWKRQQLEIIRRAARLAGVPYQTYLKQVAVQRAIKDLRAAREAGIDIS